MNLRFIFIFLFLVTLPQTIFSMQREIECSSSSSLPCFESKGYLFGETKNKQCSICLEDKIEEKFETLDCTHSFCLVCLIQVVTKAIDEKRSIRLKCPQPTCPEKLTKENIQRILDNDKKSKLEEYDDLITKEYLTKNPDVKWCQSPNCQFVFINDENKLQTIQCPECNEKYCSVCLTNHPMEITCAQAKGKANKEEFESEQLKLAETSNCPDCRAPIQKLPWTCDEMRCENCGHEFCWACLGPYYYEKHNCNRSEAIRREQAKQDYLKMTTNASSSKVAISEVSRVVNLPVANHVQENRAENAIRIEQENRERNHNLELINAIRTFEPDINEINRLLQRPGIVNAKTDRGWTALMYALNNLAIVDILLKTPEINVNIKNDDGDTALILATQKEYNAYPLVLRLLGNPNIDIKIKNKQGYTALDLAIKERLVNIIKLLKNHI